MKIYLAAYETQCKNYDPAVPLDTNVFLTYYYKNITENSLKKLKERQHKGIITIDSGAHSFFEKMGISVTSSKKKDSSVPDPHAYFKNYFEWAKEWADHFDYFCELDLQELVGKDTVDQWRDQINKAGIGHKLITVHHSFNNWEDFVKLCKNSKSKYIAIEGIRKGQSMMLYNKYIKYAYDRGIKIHGFAFTRTKLLYHFPFYSVDSSSWTTAIRYGAINKFEYSKIKTVKSSKAHFFENNLDMDLHSSKRDRIANKKKLEYSAKQYRDLEVFFTKLWTSRGINWKE